MPTVRGRTAVRRFIASVPGELETKILRGAARAAATVVADEAKARSVSAEVSDAIKVSARREGGRVVAKVQVKGPGAYKAPWLEYGTSAHWITVADADRNGMSIGRINRLQKEGSLVIGGNFVGASVWHPGAEPHPFLRPALDAKATAAIAAAQGYITAHVGRAGFMPAADPSEEA